MKEELYGDVLEELEEKQKKSKNFKETCDREDKFHKRLKKTIGWIDFEPIQRQQVWKGKLVKGSEVISQDDWMVNAGDGGRYSTDRQMEAHILAYLVQMDIRLRRMEKKLNEMSDVQKRSQVP